MKIFVAINQSRVLYDFKRELIAALSARGDDVFLSFEEDFRAPFFGPLGTIVPTPIDPRGVNPVRDLRLYRFYRRELKRIRPDVVLTFTIKPNVYCGLACRRARLPYLATISGMGTAASGGGALQRISTSLYRLGLRGAARVFCQNAAIERRVVAEKIARTEQIVSVNGSGVDLERFSVAPYPNANEPTRLLFIGRLMRDKGVAEFVEAARRVRQQRPDVVFQILGATERACSEHFLVRNAERAGIVEYWGYQEDVAPTIRAASAVVLPSYHEGLSNVLLESAASARPILASNVPGCAETFDDGVSGFGFEPKSVDSLTAAIENFLRLPNERRAEMGRAGRRKVENGFSRADVVKKYLAQIDEIAAKR